MPRSKRKALEARAKELRARLERAEASLEEMPVPMYGEIADIAAITLKTESERVALVLKREMLAKKMVDMGARVERVLKHIHRAMEEVRHKSHEIDQALAESAVGKPAVRVQMGEFAAVEAERQGLEKEARHTRLLLARNAAKLKELPPTRRRRNAAPPVTRE